jgi:PKHD-type hydroxylase
VAPITRGTRTSCFFWVQSLIRDDSQRGLAVRDGWRYPTPHQTNADEAARRSLIGCYQQPRA